MHRTLSATFLSLSALAGASHAEDTPLPPIGAATPAAATAPIATAAAAQGTNYLIGLGAGLAPEYEGSKKTRLVPIPLLEAQFANGIFVSSARGLGYQRTVEGVSLGAALAYGGARADHKENSFYGSDDFKGMGKVKGSVQLNLSASAQFGAVAVSVGTTQALSHRENGSTYSIGAAAPLYTNGADSIGWSVSAEYGDAKHMQTYYGVTAAQSLASGYRQASNKAGFEKIQAGLHWEREIDKSWVMRSALGVSALLGGAADSPLTRRRVAPVLMTGVGYKF